MLKFIKAAPFILLAKQLTDSSRSYTFHLTRVDMTGGNFLYGPQDGEKSYPFRLEFPFTVDGQSFVLAPKRRISNDELDYIARWEPVESVAAKLSSDLNVKALDIKTSVVELSIKTGNLQFGKDLLNALFQEFHLQDIDDRDKLYESTVRFVDERLLAISGELKGVEGNLENFQGTNQLIDIRGQSNQYLENSNAVSKTIKDIAIQQSVVAMIQEYFSNPANTNKLVPSSLGLNDGTLSLLITQYNELQLKKEREAPLVAPNSTVMQDLNTQLIILKAASRKA